MSYDAASTGIVHGEHRWDFVFATLYDRIMRRGEGRTMRERRGELVAKARGRTLEIGPCAPTKQPPLQFMSTHERHAYPKPGVTSFAQDRQLAPM